MGQVTGKRWHASHLILSATLQMDTVIILLLLIQHWVSKTQSNLPKVTERARAKARVPTRAIPSPEPAIKPQCSTGCLQKLEGCTWGRRTNIVLKPTLDLRPSYLASPGNEVSKVNDTIGPGTGVAGGAALLLKMA